MRTTAHQIILLLLCCNTTAAAGSLFHRSSQRQPVVSSIPSHTQKQTHHRHFYTSRAFFQLVPRGGGHDDDGTNHKEDKEINNVAKEYYYQELSKQLQKTEDDFICSSDESYNYDVEVDDDDDDDDTDEESHHQTPLPLDPILLDPTEIKGEKVDEYYNDGKENNNDGMTKITILPKFLFPTHHLTSTVPSTMIHIAHVVLQAAKRSLLAGARAITQVERNADYDSDDAVKKLMVDDDEEGPRRPVVRTLVGKTVFVLGEMYHAARTTTSTDDDVEQGDGAEDDKSLKHRRHRRRRRRRSEESSSSTAAAATRATTASPSHRRNHHRHRNKARYTTSPTAVVCNGGGMEPHNNNNNLLNLAKRHKINLPTDDNDNDDDSSSSSSSSSKNLPKKYDSILLNPQTSLSEALQKSNSDARFLICYISNNNTKKKVTSTSTTTSKSDTIAYSSLLSPEVVKHINRRPLGKKQADGSTGSYYIWIMSGDENDDTMKKDVELAMKRLKVKPPTSSSGGGGGGSSKKKKRKQDGPILAIIYPATTIDTSTGKLKVTPRLLAQHHCNPPPSSPDVMINWTNTIRKRHIREFAKLQHDRKEIQLLKERNEGYVTSMKEDKAREEKEELEARAKKEMEEKERLRKEKLEERRRGLIEALVDEPEVGETGVITIALRFTDGSRDQRRFVADETSMNDVFNWVDAMHGLEREKIELSTMNGSKTFVYVEEEEEEEKGENMTLEEAGLGKMTALRVTEIVSDDDAADKEEDDDDEQESDSSE